MPPRNRRTSTPMTIQIAKVTIAGRSPNGTTIYEVTDTTGTKRRTAAGTTAGYAFSWARHLSASGREAEITVSPRGTIDSLVLL